MLITLGAGTGGGWLGELGLAFTLEGSSNSEGLPVKGLRRFKTLGWL